MVGVLGSNPSVDTKQIPKQLISNTWEFFFSCLASFLAQYMSHPPSSIRHLTSAILHQERSVSHAAGRSQCRQRSGSSRDEDAEDNLPYRILFHSDLDFLLILVLIFEEGGRSNEEGDMFCGHIFALGVFSFLLPRSSGIRHQNPCFDLMVKS